MLLSVYKILEQILYGIYEPHKKDDKAKNKTCYGTTVAQGIFELTLFSPELKKNSTNKFV